MYWTVEEFEKLSIEKLEHLRYQYAREALDKIRQAPDIQVIDIIVETTSLILDKIDNRLTKLRW